MLYRLLPDPEGTYLNPAGARVTLQAVRWSNHAEQFTAFDTLEACLAAWGLEECTKDPSSPLRGYAEAGEIPAAAEAAALILTCTYA